MPTGLCQMEALQPKGASVLLTELFFAFFFFACETQNDIY